MRGEATIPNSESKNTKVLKQLPEVWALLRPRRALLAVGLLLMAINRVSGLALPASAKFLIDDVIGRRQTKLLLPLVATVLTATLIQGVTSFALTQLLSKAAQRLIAELRRKVQEHVGRLPVAYYDANKTGALVSRIMNDVEGVRNLIGTGLVEFLGGLLTASIALVVLVRISAVMTGVTIALMLVSVFALRKAFGVIRPIFRERSKINAEVSGRLTESLAGVRVVKGYHAEQREHLVFSKGVQRLLDNVLRTLTTLSMMSFSTTALLGVAGALVMWIGAHQVLSGSLTLGGYFTYTMFLAFMVAPLIQVVGIGTQLTEAIAGLERTREVLNERPEDEDPRRVVTLTDMEGRVAFENVTFSYEPGKPVLHGCKLPGFTRNRDCARGVLRVRKVYDHRAGRRVSRAFVRTHSGGPGRSRNRSPRFLPHATWRGTHRNRSCLTAVFARTSLSPARARVRTKF